MINILTSLVLSSISGSFTFIIIFAFQKFLSDDYLTFFYSVMKVTGVIFLLPILFFSMWILNTYSLYEVVEVNLEDFKYARRFIGLKTLNYLTNTRKIASILTAVYFIIAVFLYTFNCIRSRLLIIRLIKGSYECLGERKKMFRELCVDLKISKTIPIHVSGVIKTPGVIGIFRPGILIPNLDLDEESWYLLLKHELVHLKNHDLLFRNILDMVRVLHWFNPIIYRWMKLFFETGEFVCDKITVGEEDKNKRKKYIHLILSLAGQSPAKTEMAYFSDNYDYRILERRIRNIMKSKTTGKKAIKATLAVVLALSCYTVSYASTVMTLNLQDKIITDISDRNSVEEGPGFLYKEYVEIDSGTNDFKSGGSLAKGTTQVDYVLSATEDYRYDTMDLSKGTTVTIAVYADSSSDSFKAGLVDEHGTKRYALSNRGKLTKDFTINETGTYSIFFQGNNSDGQSIHLKGAVIIME